MVAAASGSPGTGLSRDPPREAHGRLLSAPGSRTHTRTRGRAGRAPSARGPPAAAAAAQPRSWVLLPGPAPWPARRPLGLLPPSLQPPTPQPSSPNSLPASAAREEAGGAAGRGGAGERGEKKKVNSLALRALPSLAFPGAAAGGGHGRKL